MGLPLLAIYVCTIYIFSFGEDVYRKIREPAIISISSPITYWKSDNHVPT